MNKKKRVIIAGLLLLITTTASTYAYFNKSVTLSENSGEQPFSLNITNGQISITAGVGNGTTTPTWSYDVARLSTSTATYGLYGITDTNADGKIDENDTDYITKYINVNRTMDISGVSSTGADASGRKAIGAELTSGTISNARPGDALVVGTASSDEGIFVTNNTSSLTVKVKVEVNKTAEAENTIKYLDQAGWIMYIDGTKVNDGSGTLNLDTIQTALDSLATVLNPNESITNKIKIRLELPLLTGNAFENKSVGTGGTQAAFDVSTLFKITATQENNPGWSEAGN